jgi:hypothetical protein
LIASARFGDLSRPRPSIALVIRPSLYGPARTRTPGSRSSRREDAELVALRIGQNDPRFVALSDIGIRRAEVDQASYLSLLVDRTEIEVKPVLDRLRLRHSSKQQARDLVGRRSDLEFFGIVVHNDPAQC